MFMSFKSRKTSPKVYSPHPLQRARYIQVRFFYIHVTGQGLGLGPGPLFKLGSGLLMWRLVATFLCNLEASSLNPATNSSLDNNI